MRGPQRLLDDCWRFPDIMLACPAVPDHLGRLTEHLDHWREISNAMGMSENDKHEFWTNKSDLLK
jgi:hypothetical protein